MRKPVRLTLILLSFLVAATAHAETWPSRLIKASIPFGAGSATDVVPRLVFDRLAAELGQPIVVENRVGAGGTLGTAMVVRADPDGDSVLGAFFGAGDRAGDLSRPELRRHQRPRLGADDRLQRQCDDRAGVAAVEDGRRISSRTPGPRPGSISFGSVGVGSAVHISAEKFRLAAGIEATHVPYRGGAEVIADIIGGRIDFYFCPLATALPLIHAGQVRALVVSTPQRVAELPDVPTPAGGRPARRRERDLVRRVHAVRRRRATSSRNS